MKIRSWITKSLLKENFEIKKKALDQVKFKSSKLSDSHIREIVNLISKRFGIPAQLIDTQLASHIVDIEKMKTYSKLLYDTAAKNAAASAAFKVLQTFPDYKFEDRRVKWDLAVFKNLIDLIQDEHEQFFPLRAPGEMNYILSIAPIIVPTDDPKLDEYNKITTAAATSGGDFIFNKNFMQQLMDFAVLENSKPKGKKYQSNGGVIPDAYAPIEFLILHELLHYAYGDFNKSKRLSQYSHQVHNFASDFRSNYMLVKNGYEQLPLGLFSDFINYDRQEKYDELCKVVHDELKKLPHDLQQKFEEISELDDHDDQDESGKDSDIGGKGTKWTPKVGEKVKLPDGSPAIVKSIENGKAVVERISS
jgi:hypothetical protein